MKTRLSGIRTLGSIVAAVVAATIPLMAQAGSQTSSASTAESREIAALKHQIYLCHHHPRHHRAVCPIVVEKQVIVEKPVIVEKIVEKQVFVDRPAVVEEKQEQVVEKAVEMDQRVVVEHSKHRKHLLHMGIPFIAVTLF